MTKFSIYIYIINIIMNVILIDLTILPNIEHVLEMNIYLSFVLTKYFFNNVYV